MEIMVIFYIRTMCTRKRRGRRTDYRRRFEIGSHWWKCKGERPKGAAVGGSPAGERDKFLTPPPIGNYIPSVVRVVSNRDITRMQLDRHCPRPQTRMFPITRKIAEKHTDGKKYHERAINFGTTERQRILDRRNARAAPYNAQSAYRAHFPKLGSQSAMGNANMIPATPNVQVTETTPCQNGAARYQ